MQRIKSVGVLSVATVSGMCYGAMGLLLVPIFRLFAAIGFMAPKQPGMPGFAPAFGIAFAVCAPVLYGAMGFVIGALGAFIYNLIAGWIGGVEIELEPGSTTWRHIPVLSVLPHAKIKSLPTLSARHSCAPRFACRT